MIGKIIYEIDQLMESDTEESMFDTYRGVKLHSNTKAGTTIIQVAGAIALLVGAKVFMQSFPSMGSDYILFIGLMLGSLCSFWISIVPSMKQNYIHSLIDRKDNFFRPVQGLRPDTQVSYLKYMISKESKHE